jgi:hypothetical protein
MTEYTPLEQEIIRKGEIAADFMRHPCFDLMVKELQADIAAAIIATDIEEEDRREAMYLVYHALKELVSKMEQYKAAKEMIESGNKDSQD